MAKFVTTIAAQYNVSNELVILNERLFREIFKLNIKC